MATNYYSIHFKKAGKKKGFIAIKPGKDEAEVYDAAKSASFGSMFFPDINSIKKVSKYQYQKYRSNNTKKS